MSPDAARLSDPAERFAPGQVLGARYRIVSLLGRGGMGEVYRADDLRLGLPVALKFLPRTLESDARALARLHAEVRNARHVSHPHVCRIHDLDQVDGRSFLTMEFVDGEDLASLLRRIGRLSDTKVLEFARQICAGLQAAHDRGVVHRDLKPANVMIDGHGRVRITDFGLAVSASDSPGEIAGTPAYMAPEQWRGDPATSRSDVYALGLLLYEVCTGRRPFIADSYEDWRRAHTTEVPADPATVTRDVDPAVARVVLRCLEKDPTQRPLSAAHVSLGLPGGDPLAAAVAAGETPSPAMVAAARTDGVLHPGRATGLLAGFVLCVAGLTMTSQPHLHRMVPFEKPPEVLADRAATLVAAEGYRRPVADRAWAYQLDQTYLGWSGDPLVGRDRWRRLTTGQPLTFAFWYRQSPVPLEPLGRGGQVVTMQDPPATVEGMASVLMDPRGRLVEFKAVPDAATPNAAGGEADWRRLFEAAGLDPGRLTPVAPTWTPPVPADQRAAWTGTFADHPDLPLRVEAAAFRGRAVYFRAAGPWDAPPARPPDGLAKTEIAGIAVAATLIIGVLAGAAWLVRRNLRLGRGDRSGADRIAVVAGVAAACMVLLESNAPSTLGGVARTMAGALQIGLLAALAYWMCYLAAEPYIRRHKPALLVSWTRLLSGHGRDPLVGRDLLIGAWFGVGGASSLWISGWLKVWMSHPLPPNHYVFPATVGHVRDAIGSAFGLGLFYLWVNLAILVVLVLARRIVRHERAALLLFGLAGVVIEVLLYARSWPAVAASVISWVFAIGAVSQLGLVAGLAGGAVYGLLAHYPVTADPAAAYAGNAWLAIGLACAIATYGWWTSMGPRRPTRFSAGEE